MPKTMSKLISVYLKNLGEIFILFKNSRKFILHWYISKYLCKIQVGGAVI